MTEKPPLSHDDIALIAEQVSLMMQLDRTHHHVGRAVDMSAVANVPDYIAGVFEEAGAITTEMSPAELYAQVNKRVAQVQAQIYLLRVEMEHRAERDPAQIYRDPLVVAAYGERLETLTGRPKSFGFGSAVLAHGWHPIERNEAGAFRWMRPGEVSVACLPHLGCVDQTIEIKGYVLDVAQLDGLVICSGDIRADITPDPETPRHFTARLTLTAEDVQSANYLPVEFSLTDFRQPSPQDPRLLGANISRFTCLPVPAA